MAITRLGLQIPSFTYPGCAPDQLFEQLAAIATTAEANGFDSVWVPDHVDQITSAGPRTAPVLEAYTLLAGLAVRTSRVKLGALVTGMSWRNPALLAKIVATLDVLSGGRAVLGIGAGWDGGADDGSAFSFRMPPAAERLGRLDEALQICRALFNDETPACAGRYYRIDHVLLSPRPVRPGGPPILVGGGGERRTLRLVAQHADACNLFGDPSAIRHKLEVLRRHCEAVGRDPADVERTRLGTLVAGGTQAEAEERAARLFGRHPENLAPSPSGPPLVAGPERLAEEVDAFLAAGLDGLIFNLADADDLGSVALAGHALTDALALADRA